MIPKTINIWYAMKPSMMAKIKQKNKQEFLKISKTFLLCIMSFLMGENYIIFWVTAWWIGWWMARSFLMSFFSKQIDLLGIWNNISAEWMLNGKFQGFLTNDQSSFQVGEKAMKEIGSRIIIDIAIFSIRLRRIQMWRTYE